MCRYLTGNISQHTSELLWLLVKLNFTFTLSDHTKLQKNTNLFLLKKRITIHSIKVIMYTIYRMINEKKNIQWILWYVYSSNWNVTLKIRIVNWCIWWWPNILCCNDSATANSNSATFQMMFNNISSAGETGRYEYNNITIPSLLLLFWNW